MQERLTAHAHRADPDVKQFPKGRGSLSLMYRPSSEDNAFNLGQQFVRDAVLGAQSLNELLT